jgi:hypothetical protein
MSQPGTGQTEQYPSPASAGMSQGHRAVAASFVVAEIIALLSASHGDAIFSHRRTPAR